MAWKKTKKTNYGLKLLRQDLWGKYAKKISNRKVINKQEFYIKYHDDLVNRIHSSAIFWWLKQEKRKREGYPFPMKEKEKERKFRTRKLLKCYYDNLSFHNIKIHMKRAQVKNDYGYTLNFYKMLERRLDVMCLRVFFYNTLREAKQFINNGCITVNGKIMQSVNYILKDDDILSVRGDLRYTFKKKYLDDLQRGRILRPLPPYLRMNLRTFEIKFIKEFFNIYKIPHLGNFPIHRFPNFIKKP
jgi:ribosomal protein S4